MSKQLAKLNTKEEKKLKCRLKVNIQNEAQMDKKTENTRNKRK